jgi:hypothetical protein
VENSNYIYQYSLFLFNTIRHFCIDNYLEKPPFKSILVAFSRDEKSRAADEVLYI